jgi:hypothetical protein
MRVLRLRANSIKEQKLLKRLNQEKLKLFIGTTTEKDSL